MDALQDVVAALAEELHVPGVAVGVLLDGREAHAFHGVTSIENPLPVDERTLFLCGSTTKTYTATAIARLVGQGLVDLDAPARTYVPELQVEDEEAAASVTVLQLLNHTRAGTATSSGTPATETMRSRDTSRRCPGSGS